MSRALFSYPTVCRFPLPPRVETALGEDGAPSSQQTRKSNWGLSQHRDGALPSELGLSEGRDGASPISRGFHSTPPLPGALSTQGYAAALTQQLSQEQELGRPPQTGTP